MQVIVTRHQPDCARWCQALQKEGFSAVALPLIAIESLAFDVPVPAGIAAPSSKSPYATLSSAQTPAKTALIPYDAVVFVSPNAVAGFFQSQTVDALQGLQLLVVGPGTRAALIHKGLRARHIDAPDTAAAQLDSEALWDKVRHQRWQGRRVLVVQGSNAQGQPEGRTWLAEQLSQAGALVSFVSVYRRCLPRLGAGEQALLAGHSSASSRASSGAHPQQIWILSSSIAIAHLQQLAPHRSWADATALTTHPRIQAKALEAGFGRAVLTQPVLVQVIQTLKDIEFAR